MYDSRSWSNNGSNTGGWLGQNPSPFGNYPRQAPHYEIVKVNGEAGARAFQMAPNSSLFLADATNPNLIWLVQTDGAGYLTPTPLDVSIHQEQPQPNYSNLEERVKHLEDMYGQLNSGLGKQSKKQRQQSTTATTVIAEQSTDSTD